MATFFGYKGNEDKFPSAEDRGVMFKMVVIGGGKQVMPLRPMTVSELSARDARKSAAATGLKITITDGDGNFIRNEHSAQIQQGG